ncbi:MAG: hypothetical protein E6Q97_37090 [Desulfurellales bacterium]|nr:MAG: hypothetical protein E6Q97_37090 [Desulfurellales bacterium]
MAPRWSHQLGPFQFLSMRPCPPTRRRRLVVETRPGSNGFAVWIDGTRGELWRPETVVDVPSQWEGQILKAQYEAACGSDPVVLQYAVDFENPFETQTWPDVIIKDVEVEIRDQLIGIGGFNHEVGALVYARWEILIR